MDVQSKIISKRIRSELRKGRTFFSCQSHSLSDTVVQLQRGLQLQRLTSRNESQRLSRRETKISAPVRKSRRSSCRPTPATAHADFSPGKAQKGQ